MSVKISIDIDQKETLRNIAKHEQVFRNEFRSVVKETTTNARKFQKSVLKPHQYTGNMVRSIRQKIVRPKAIQPTIEDKGLFRTVKPRGHKGSPSNFFDKAGTKTTPALNWRARTRSNIEAGFRQSIGRVVNKKREL